MKHLLYIALIVGAVITVGTAMAATDFSGGGVPVNVNGDLNVNGGKLGLNNAGFVADRDDNVQTSFRILNEGKQSSFRFEDVDANKVYSLRYPDGGNNFQLFDSTNARADLTVKTTTGNIGIGTTNPQERLHVDGNLQVTGNLVTSNIVSTGDICIGTCPP